MIATANQAKATEKTWSLHTRLSGFCRLRRNVFVADHTASGELHLIADTTVFFRNPPVQIRDAVRLLEKRTGVPTQSLVRILGSTEVTEWLLDHLTQKGLLQWGEHEHGSDLATSSNTDDDNDDDTVDEGADDPTTAYFDCIASSIKSARNAKSALAEKNVWIVGCGGIGALVAQHLVGAGLRRLTLIDFDCVNKTNLNRQFLFTSEDIGRDKLEAAKDRLLRLCPDVEVTLLRHRFGFDSDADEALLQTEAARKGQEHGVDACVCAADTPPEMIRDRVSLLAERLGATFAAAGVGLFVGSWGPILTPDDPVPYHAWRDPAALPRDGSLVVPPLRASFGPTNALIAAYLARDLVHVLVGEDAPSRGCRIALDFGTLDVTRFPVSVAAVSATGVAATGAA
jgi:molybdopterin/thiamine biosynthesis adenylyltransferase